jgi:hypothetical protein
MKVYEKTDGFWVLLWDFLEFPDTRFTIKNKFFEFGGLRKSALKLDRIPYENIEIFIHDTAITFLVPNSDENKISLPNSPECLKMLEDLILCAKRKQRKIGEEERIQSIKTLKKLRYLDKDASEHPLKR